MGILEISKIKAKMWRFPIASAVRECLRSSAGDARDVYRRSRHLGVPKVVVATNCERPRRCEATVRAKC